MKYRLKEKITWFRGGCFPEEIEPGVYDYEFLGQRLIDSFLNHGNLEAVKEPEETKIIESKENKIVDKYKRK